MEKMVVTAERRSASLQTTPFAALVLSGMDFAHKGCVAVDQLQFIPPRDPAMEPVCAIGVDQKDSERTCTHNFSFDVVAPYEVALGGKDMLTPRIDYEHTFGQWATLFEANFTDQRYVGAVNPDLRYLGPPHQSGERVMMAF